jgi:hypothetical protein
MVPTEFKGVSLGPQTESENLIKIDLETALSQAATMPLD